jgi:ABC-type lipoprotein export system ATPase subunit
MSYAAPVVEAIGLEKTYRGKIEVPVLKGVDLVIYPGEFVAIIGQSGSGKSTLLNLIGCLDRATGGSLRIAGMDVAAITDDELADLRADCLGFVFQFHYLLDEFTCKENVLLPLLIRRGQVTKEDEARAVALLERVGLGAQLEQTPDTMSGGQCQRCAIVRSLVNHPRVILADEPTGNLDSTSGAEVFRLLREMSRDTGVAVVMVTHDERLAAAADRIVSIQDGQIHEQARNRR